MLPPADGIADRGLLVGHLVVELGDRVAVGACGSLLAQLGAEVVLVETAHPRSHHKWRDRAVTAAGKRSLIVDANSPDDRELLTRVLAAADVVLLSSDLSAEERDLWEAARPSDQVMCDVTAFGHTGPLAGVAGTEAHVQAQAGISETTGSRDGLPALLGAPLLEMESGVYAAAAIMGALRVRRLHGFGQRIDIAAYDVAVNALAAFLPLPFSGRVATRNGNRHPTLSPWNSYRAQDGWVIICAPTGEQWERLCGVMNRPELVHDARFATTTSRMEHADVIDEVIGAWVASHAVAECVDALTRHVLPCGPVVGVDALAEEPNLRHRRMVRTADDPESGRRIMLPGCPVRWRGSTRSAAVPVRGDDRVHVEALVSDRSPVVDAVQGDPASPVRPLEGIRVVEIGMNTVGPLAGKQLGALGADVIKIEPPHGDSNRHNAPLRADGEAYIFALLNTDKRGLVLDLRADADRTVLWELLGTADVVIENLKPGSLGRLGFGADEVHARLPELIYCSMNGFGHDSVYPGRPALDTVVQAMSGVMSATTIDGVPTKAGISISDQLGGLFGLLGVLAALDHREIAGGPGAVIDIAMQDASAWATQRLWNGPPASEARIVSTAGGPVLEVNGERSPVRTVADVLTHPQTEARGLIVERPTADGDSWPVLESPLRLLSTPAAVRSALPRLGVVDSDLAVEIGLTTSQDRHCARASTLAGKES